MSVLDKYKAHTHKEHIYKIPDTYIGSVEPCIDMGYVVDGEKMTKKSLTSIPGLYKIVDEVIVNAWDQFIRYKDTEKNRVKNIDIEVCRETGRVSVTNTGRGIDILMHPEHEIYTVELIFGKLLTSTNYTEGEERVTGGKNGYGAKLANIFSKEFEVETIDFQEKKKYTQKFTENMDVRHEPVILKIKRSEYKQEYTRVSFIPDFERFKLATWTDDMFSILERRAYEIAACCGSSVSVSFNKKSIEVNSFQKFSRMFLENPVYEKCGPRWEIAIGLSETYQHISFVNGIFTAKGGKHVEYITQTICKKMGEYLMKKHKIDVKANYIREHLFVFVNSLITNPSFDSQTKDFLTTPLSRFGSKCDISDKCIDTIAKQGLAERVIETYNFKETKLLKKTDGKKKLKLLGIPKLDDANEAGGKHSPKCTLILTEGDSAKAMAVAGLGVVGRDYYGVFPLRGKVINVREKIVTKQGRTQVLNNVELNHMKQILGLEQDIKYKDVTKLRYGHILIMTDQDYDGSHIKGLLMNWFDTFWPELLQIEGFIQCMQTPIVKVFKKGKEQSFYSISKYNEWKKKSEKKGGIAWTAKYYKGLGTSTTKEAKEYFKELRKTTYTWKEDSSTRSLDMAFHKDRADDRKAWLKLYNPDDVLEDSDTHVPFTDFVNKELIHFSNYDLQRSIPHIMDGLKPSQRKILFGCFKRKLVKEIRVAQLAGYISEHTGYHHGEESLNKAIIAMAQTFVGSNNIHLLEPNGQFGTRLMGGKDSGSPRYLHTALSPITSKIFVVEDAPLLNYLDDDGLSIEPSYYVPVLPMILVNGAQGIGTGYSTSIPLYNPKDLIGYLRHKIEPEKYKKPHLMPYYTGFQGKILETSDGILTKGVYKIVNYKTILITELPIGSKIDGYKTWLDEILVENSNTKEGKDAKDIGKSSVLAKAKPKEDWKCLKNYKSQSTETQVHFEVEIDPGILSEWVSRMSKEKKNNGNSEHTDFIEQKFRLTSKVNTTNMHLYNTQGVIQKFSSCDEIMETFFTYRAPFYTQRKEHILAMLDQEMCILMNKMRFIRCIFNNELDIRSHSKGSLHDWLDQHGFEKDPRQPKESSTFAYLTGMPMYHTTTDMVAELEESIAKKKKERDDLFGKTLWNLWTHDLDALEAAMSSSSQSTKKK